MPLATSMRSTLWFSGKSCEVDMVRVWFGDESQGLKRDREEFVLTLHRACSDTEAAKTFYCDSLDFHVVGVTRRDGRRQTFLNHKRMPSFSLCLTEMENSGFTPDDFILDIGMWDQDEWHACRERLKAAGYPALAEKTANPFQMISDHDDPDGFKVRLTCTQRPKNTGKGPDFSEDQ
tara:strand:- start:26013 stop:26543 length:531 start_codon:yes stop_codon:yes gene_type:complete